ncbi:MAG: hypothetical protein AAGF12_17480 [Myxococcota bacterium]
MLALLHKVRLLFFITGLIGACTGTPVTEPPNVLPPDPNLVATLSGTGTVAVVGQPGAVAPMAVVVGVDIDSTDPAERMESTADGAFTLNFTPPLTLVRLFVEAEGTRSAPLDLEIDTGAPKPPSCLEVPSVLRFTRSDAPERLELRVQSECPSSIAVSGLRLRTASESFSIEAAPPVLVEAGSTTTIPVVYDPASGPGEEILILESADLGDRFVVTLEGNL